MFIDGAIAGVAAFNAWLTESDFNGEFDQSWGEVGFATRVSSYREFITIATGSEAVFVPEPSLTTHLLVTFVLVGLRVRRHRLQDRPICTQTRSLLTPA